MQKAKDQYSLNTLNTSNSAYNNFSYCCHLSASLSAGGRLILTFLFIDFFTFNLPTFASYRFHI